MFKKLFGGVTVGGLGYYGYFRYTEKSKPFSCYSTAEEAMNNKDLTGRTAIVTGCNTGIGKETARVLVKQGCNVIMACRTESKALTARKDILNNLNLPENYDKLSFIKLDLSSLDSVSQFANEFSSKELKIDYLINNAGIMALPEYRTSKDGFEMQFATNHLGHFYLTQLLLPNILNGGNSDELPRIINVSSVGEKIYPNLNKVYKLFDDSINELTYMPESWKSEYDPWNNYSISKSSNILFARQLNKLYKDKLTAVSLHPGGIIETELIRDVTMKDQISFTIQSIKTGFMTPKTVLTDLKDIAQGASTTIRCVSMNDNEIIPGGYYYNCQNGESTLGGPSSKDADGKLAEKLWQLSEKLIESRRG